jgi:hypothetical protein
MGNSKERDHSEDLDRSGRKILEWVIGKYGEGCGLDSSGSG